MKPLIGINIDIVHSDPDKYRIDRSYPNAIIKAGGIPILLPPSPRDELRSLLETLDAVMLIGGDDYDPTLYSESCGPHTEIGVRERQDFDVSLARYVIENTNLPVLGICAGCQLTNIILGGSLIQDIPSCVPDSEVNHANDAGAFRSHDVQLKQGSRLARIYNLEMISTPTWHHQAVNRLGLGLNAVAHAADNIIEAIELHDDQRFIIGVQWHPEQDLNVHMPLFRSFIAASLAPHSTNAALPAMQVSQLTH